MRYYSRQWDESRGDGHDGWGRSQWLFATDDTGQVLKQVEVYSGGQVLRYDASHIEDDYGRLAGKPLDLVDFEPFVTTEAAFLEAWPPGTLPGPSGKDRG